MRCFVAERATRPIVDADARQARVRRVDQDGGKSGVDQPVAFVADQGQRDHDQPVENQTAWKFHQFGSSLTGRLDVVQHHFAAVRGEPRDDAADPLKGRLLVEERNENADQPTALSLFSGRFSRPVVPEFFRGCLHLGAGGVADFRAPTEDARHGADTDTRVFGDLSHCGHVETLVLCSTREFTWSVAG